MATTSNTHTRIIPFDFESRQVRIVQDDNGEPLFVAKDVAEALGYVWNGAARIEHVPAEWRGVTSVVTPSGMQEMAVLTEQGLYFFLGRSDKPGALPLQKKVAGEILPAIRKTGSYSVRPTREVCKSALDGPHVQALKLTPLAMRAAKAFGFKGNQAALSANRFILKATTVNVLEAMGQAALAAPTNAPLLTATDLALRLGIGKREANPLLSDCGLQTSHRDHKNRVYYELTSEGHKYGVAMDTGKLHSNGTPVRQLKWSADVLSVLMARLQVESEHHEDAA